MKENHETRLMGQIYVLGWNRIGPTNADDTKGVNIVPNGPVWLVFSLLEHKTIQKHMDFVLFQISVIPGCSGYIRRNIIFQPEKLYRTKIDQDF